jgi:hypothetical protein
VVHAAIPSARSCRMLDLPSQEHKHHPAPIDATGRRAPQSDLRQPGDRCAAASRTVPCAGRRDTRARWGSPLTAAAGLGDELGPETTPVRGHEPDHLVEGRSGAPSRTTRSQPSGFRWLAEISVFPLQPVYLRGRFGRAGRLSLSPPPASTSYRRCHNRNVSGLIPREPAT